MRFKKPKPITKTPAWARGMRKIGPGMYIDGANAFHFSGKELCEAFDVPHSAENERVARETAVQVIREQFGDLPVTVVDEEDD
jgi:hypothetical protein